MEESQGPSARSEIIKFLILVGVCVVVVLVVALARPLIFNRIVPAVMGDDLPDTVEPVDEEPPVVDDTAYPVEENSSRSVDEESMAEPEAEPEAETETEEAAVEEGAAVEAIEEEEKETAVSDSDETTHTVQEGDTLFSIARRYSVTVEEIAEANDLEDVNRVVLGQELVIPQD